MNASPRTHFVYRVYDEFDLLLYVGCTAHPENRLKQHKADRAPWLPHMSRVRMEGPYTKAAGFAQEKSVIATEEPYFNSLPSHVSHNARRRRLRNDLYRQLRVDQPDLFHDGPHDPVRFEAFRKASDEIDRECDREWPEISREWRLANYLNARRREAVTSA